MNEIFRNNPGLTEFYQTSDGTAFYTENTALNHARTLKDKSVLRVEKETPAPKKTKKTTTKTKAK